jgi:hypothetical protein
MLIDMSSSWSVLCIFNKMRNVLKFLHFFVFVSKSEKAALEIVENWEICSSNFQIFKKRMAQLILIIKRLGQLQFLHGPMP